MENIGGSKHRAERGSIALADIALGLTEQDCQTTESLQPSLLPPDSLASLSVLPGSEAAIQMTVTSGRRHSQLLKPSSPPGYCLKMLLESQGFWSQLVHLNWHLRPLKQFMTVTYGLKMNIRSIIKYQLYLKTFKNESYIRSLETLKKQDTKFHELGKANPSFYVCQLAPSTPRIDETGCGLWPTMRANLTGDINENRASDKFNNLESVLSRQMWPTPQAKDNDIETMRMRKYSGMERRKGKPEAQYVPVKQGETGQLNPNWVEWLQGFPPNWTEVD